MVTSSKWAGLVAACAWWCAAASATAAGEPFLEKTDLFVAGHGGYARYHIPGVVVTAKGTVLAWCEARKTWSEPRKIADVPGPKAKNPVALRLKDVRPDDVTYNNPVLIADRGGA